VIITLTEALLERLTATDGRILRDRVLCGFAVRANKRRRTFLIATSVKGKQVRMMLGYWPLMSVEEARGHAMAVLRECRAGRIPSRAQPKPLPTLREALIAYGEAKNLKASSRKRYDSLFRTHFAAWLDRSVDDLTSPAFAEHCAAFASSKGNALVEVGRGVVTALIRYVNAVHGLQLESPFTRLAGAGLLPERAKPRARVLQEADLPSWFAAVESVPEKPRDYLFLALLSGLRRNEVRNLRRRDIDLVGGVLSVSDTKNGKPHSLPITSTMRTILVRRCEGLQPDDELFAGVSAEHVASMAIRAGAHRFMLHDLRKLVATVGQRIGISDAVMRRILNHTAPKTDVLHRHYVALGAIDVAESLESIQRALEPSVGRY